MLKVLFFAQTREILGVDKLEIAPFDSVEDLRAHLSAQGDKWALALQKGKLLVAVNQKLCPFTTPLKAGDEVAFFPPVTGG